MSTITSEEASVFSIILIKSISITILLRVVPSNHISTMWPCSQQHPIRLGREAWPRLGHSYLLFQSWNWTWRSRPSSTVPRVFALWGGLMPLTCNAENIRETQTKTTMRYHLKPVRMAIINQSANKCWWGCGERGTFLLCWWECRLVQPLWKAVWRYLKKLTVDLPFDPAIPVLGIYLKEPKTCSLQHYLQSPPYEQPKCPSADEWIKQLWDIYTMEYYLAIKK